jgi:hypothetical protein
MKILIDRNIARNAITHRSVEKPRSVRWGDRDVTAGVVERQAFPPRGDEEFRIEQLPFLATVTELARARRLELFTSFELQMERMRQRTRGPGYVGLNLLEGITLGKVQPPVERSIAITGFGQNTGVTEAEQMGFFHSIRESRFLDIRRAVGDAHIDDAFHLWTAEAAGLDAFLSMDKTFLNVMRRQGRRAKSPVSVWSPKDLCASLGEEPTDIDVLAARYHPFR